jgi:hypothetical protein
MPQTTQYVDANGAPITWSTAVTGGLAQADIYQVVSDDQHSNRLLWARSGQPVAAGTVAAAQAAALSTAVRALTGTLATVLDQVQAAAPAVRILPAGAASTTVRGVQNSGDTVVKVTPSGTDTIDGSGTPVEVKPGEIARFQCDGAGSWVRLVSGGGAGLSVTARALAADSAFTGTYAQRPGGTSNPAASLPFFNVRDFGAVGDGVTDDTAAIEAALAAMPALTGTFTASGGMIFFPAGRYMTQGGHISPSARRIHVRGAGRYNTFLYKIAGSTASDVFTFNGSYTGIRDLTINGDTTAASGDGIVLNAQACYALDVFVTSTGGNGITLGKTASAINSELRGVIVRLANAYGIEVVSGSGSTDCQWSNVNVGNSGKSGVRIATGAQQMTNVHVWGSGLAGSGTDKDGFWLASGNNSLTGCESETNTGHGVRIGAGCNGNLLVACDLWGNVTNGLYGFNCKKTILVGNKTRYNGVGNPSSSSTGFAGIVNESGTEWLLTGNLSWDEALAIAAGSYSTAPTNPFPGRTATFTQTYAYAETNTGTGSPDRNHVSGNHWRKQDHKTGAMLTLGVASIWGTNNLGNEPLPTTASAATTSLPAAFDLVNITGTTTITSITASNVGRRVTLQFTNASPGGLTDGGNLQLAGNFGPTGNDTITLICDGTNWIECSRSGDI